MGNRIKRIIILAFILSFFIGVISVVRFFPLKFSDEVQNISTKYQVNKEIIYSVIKIESDFRPRVTSHKGAIGLMQIMPNTGRWMAEKNNLEFSEDMLKNPEYNIEIGTLYISHLLKKYDGNIDYVLIAYNAGPTRLRNESWKNFKETKNYLIKYKISSFFYKIRLFFYNII